MLEGALVNLRAQEATDAERLHRWINDRQVTLYLGARYQASLAFEEGFMAQRAGTPHSFAAANFAIETKDGVHIGNIGLRDASPEDRGAWLGMLIGEKEYWSRGYGSDALRTLLRFAFGEMNLHRVDLDVYDFNTRGIAAYRKCGFVEEGRRRHARYQDGTYHDVVKMSVLRDEWAAGGDA
jgi:RimJ/RimL family protein N-acetyltransferase